MNALLLQSSRKISDIMQIPLIQESQLYSQLPHPSGNGDRFLRGELFRTVFGSGGKSGFYPP